MALDQETKTAIDGALLAFNELKNTLDPLKTDIASMRVKTDAFDQAKIDKLAKDIGDGLEMSQKAEARAMAAEDHNKTLAAEMNALKTAFNRPNGAAPSEEKAKEQAILRTKAFNDFARMEGENRVGYSEYLKQRGVTEPELKALAVNSDPSGGYLTMPEFGGVIKTFAYESSPIRMLASATTIGSDTLEYVTDNDTNTSGWVGEVAPRTDTATPALGKIDLYVNELYSQPSVTQKLLDDGMFDVEAWLAGKVAEEFGRKEATAFVTGTGVMQPKGLMSYTASGASTAATVAAAQIEQVNSGDAANFTYNGLVNLQNALKEPYQPNAVFLFRRASNANIMQIKDGQGRPIFNMVFDKNVGLQPTLMGQPCYYAADIAAIGANALTMAYGDIRKAYQIVDRAGIRVLRDPFTNKPYIRFYTTKRVGGGVVNYEAVKIQKMA
jgi:HK97 family phage major capsid protein